jgi:hypothetical protein
MGGFGGGHMGGFGGGHMGGFGGRGFGGRGFGRFGGFGGFYPYGYGGYYPYYGLGYGYGLGGYGYGGLGYDGLGYGYGGLGYGGYGNPGYGYGMDYGYGGGYPATGFGYSSAYVAPAAGAAGAVAPQRRVLGIDEEPVVLADGRKGMKITKVYAGTAAEQAGLQVGDVLRSVNGYLTEQRGNLAWIIANAAPDNTLKMIARTAKDGRDRTITATLPS